MGTHGERGVEQQHALAGPPREVAVLRHGHAKVIANLAEDVLQRRGEGHAGLHGEAQPMGLSRLMVGVLADDDHLHLVEGTEVEGIEDETGRRVAAHGLVLLTHGLGQLCEIGLLKLALQLSLPRLFYLYIHYFNNK